jgi:CHAT domain-containing protein
LGCALGEGSSKEVALQHTLTEVESINAAETLVGPAQFTRASLSNAVPRSTVLHLATHFRAHPSELGNSAFLLADGSQMTVRELLELDLSHLDLLVLSMCESGVVTAREQQAGNFAIDHLLLNGRIGAILATLFRVDDAASAELMKQFYENLRAGHDKARALSLAQRRLASGSAGDRWRATYFWAAPVLSGNWLAWTA